MNDKRKIKILVNILRLVFSLISVGLVLLVLYQKPAEFGKGTLFGMVICFIINYTARFIDSFDKDKNKVEKGV